MTTAHDALLTDLHETHRARLERIVTNRLRDPEVAADVTSEAFIRLHRELRDGRVPDEPAAWLTRVALNLAASEGRHRQVVFRVQASATPPPPVPGPADEVVGRDLLRRVARAMAGLPSEDRDLVLAAAAGSSGADLGAERGLSAATARVRLFRARQRLRTAIGDVG